MSNTQWQAQTTQVSALDWQLIAEKLANNGYAVVPQLLTPSECQQIVSEYNNDTLFRSRIVMQRHGFGRGEYKYYAYPLPSLVANLRETLYSPLAVIANAWYQTMGIDITFPLAHKKFIEKCQQVGQLRPTPLLVKYQQDDYNCLHQDLYGEQVFPLQIAILLAKPHVNFTGGEFILTEQRPRMQSRAEVVQLTQGDAVIFTVNQRPVQGVRGSYRVKHRHGVSRVLSGERYTLGIIFHDAT